MDNKAHEPGFGAKAAEFIGRIRFLIIGIFAVLIVALGALIVFEIVGNSRAEKAGDSLEAAAKLYSQVSSESDATKKADLEKQLQDAVSKAEAVRGTFGAQKAHVIAGRLAYDKQDYKGAVGEFQKAYQEKKDSYLAPLALLEAAAAAEDGGDVDEALKDYQAVLKDYKDSIPGISHVMFSIGRLQESKKDWAKAKAAYDDLATAYPGDSWTNLANSRIIFLKTQGLIQQ